MLELFNEEVFVVEQHKDIYPSFIVTTNNNGEELIKYMEGLGFEFKDKSGTYYNFEGFILEECNINEKYSYYTIIIGVSDGYIETFFFF